MPRVTVLIPTYQSSDHIRESLESVLDQTYCDYEILVVDDSSTDGTLDIIRSLDDPRIRVLDGPGNGLAAALNYGISQSNGEYIARLDSDDYSEKTRLEKQVKYLDDNPDVAVCGSWQLHFGTENFIHKPPADKEQCRANLIFLCDLCHSTLMLRRDFLLEHDLLYSNDFFAEDFELWTRVLEYGNIGNIPEILGYYRHSGNNITVEKKKDLMFDESRIMANTLYRFLDIRLTEHQKRFFVGYTNPFFDEIHFSDIYDSLDECYIELESVLRAIYTANLEKKAFDDNSLLRTLEAEWNHLRYNLPFQILYDEKTIDSIFECPDLLRRMKIRLIHFWNTNYGLRNKMKTAVCFILSKVHSLSGKESK